MFTGASSTGALAVRDGRIAALGEPAVRRLITGRTEVVRLRGRTLLPGFIDAHAHPVFGGLLGLRCDLTGAVDAADCLRLVGEHRGGEGWLLGGGWDSALFPGGAPSAAALDEVTGSRPAYLLNRDHHGAWVNTAALRRAGVDAATPDPPDGRIERDALGRPTGTLHEGAADLVGRVLAAPDPGEYRAALLAGQRTLHAHGVTGWQDAIVGPYLGHADLLEVYRSLDAAGRVSGRVQAALWWDRHRGPEQLPELLDRRTRGRRFRAEHVKIMVDGVCENRTAAMVHPYLGRRTGGLAHFSPAGLREAVGALAEAGFPVHFHAVGDRAVRDALDAVAAAPARGLRHQIAHAQVVRRADLPRFRELGVIANVQAAWAVHDAAMTELTLPELGAERAARQYPFRSLEEAGALLAGGSDWPVSDPAPLVAVHAAVNRCEPDGGPPLLPEQAISLRAALRAHTSGSAAACGFEREAGSLELGMAADLALLDRDLFAAPRSEIAEARVAATFVDGAPVHGG
ncbi:amidohydrolase [Saccharopolyspora sp. MS10]|uniref:amidohydrolase n=1 Tax=Saccharopolyspora sp. MS10 TaxID=3385973 RepID=UPI0039A206A7